MYDFELTRGKETRIVWSTNVDCGIVVFVCKGLGITRSFSEYDNLIVFSAYETEQMVAGEYKFEIRADGETKYSGRFEVKDQEQGGEEEQDG